MAYNELRIVNLALQKIGVEKITQSDWTTPTTQQAIDAAAVWEFVRDEVLERKDWVFAKKRVALGKSSRLPKSNFDYAYLLPSDFLRLAKHTKEGTKDDSPVYPAGYPYKIEIMDIVAEEDSIGEFNPATTYAISAEAKIGPYCDLDFNDGKDLYVCAKYNQDEATSIKVKVVTGATDTLAVASSDDVITITLAKTTSSKNAANLIQVALRALGTVNGVDVSAWTVTENALFAAARPITGEISERSLRKGNKCFTALLGTNLSKFPEEETTYWTQIVEAPTKVLVTDYDDIDGELVVAYIARVEDVTVYSASFINTVAWRMGAELSITRTEGPTKFKSCMEMYGIALAMADEVNSSSFYVDEETGNEDWIDAR